MRNGQTSRKGGVAVGLLTLAFFGAVVVDDDARGAIHLLNQEKIEFTVTEKDRVPSSDGKSARFMVWADKANGESEVFEITDSMLFWKFNSADIYGKVREGQTYTADVSGVRWPMFSMNRNIQTLQPK